ncbi:cyclic peptide export ABC transporter [Paenibacillus sp. EKM211P]|uniref:cyclic peptide export ABC transporter n=1 Tax=Paenibacillus sp. EKM211P TaxID=1683679 RepID=UPI0013E8FE09|nr:cyclic peptide export ABC transporter [Paenibacillus sp. EKM211P]KAF6582673.1 cyclic peptide export ABC transporter [Paenibacillus sp. EKM211P]
MLSKWRLSSLILLLLFSSLLSPFTPLVLANNESVYSKLDGYIQEKQKVAKIPGLAVVVVEGGNEVYEYYSGYSDVEQQKHVTSETIFEIGSNSKAFTGLAILQLEDEGLISLNDPVSKYVPWFYLKDQGEKIDVTISQLLYQTSGIPTETIGEIPALNSDDALEQTVRMLVGHEIMHHKKLRQGEFFNYATVNYDILGLIIEKVSHLSYEDYMQQKVIQPLGLKSTFMQHEDAVEKGLATGYKLGFFKPIAYEAPRYRGNVPAGYINSTPTDIATWMKIQLGNIKPAEISSSIIEKSHEPDKTVPPNYDGSSYAAGWSIYQSGDGELAHGGSNPNFSSFITMRKDQELGVAVMANLNSDHTETIAQGIMSILRGRTPVEPVPDTYNRLDQIATVILVIGCLAILALLCLILCTIVDIIKGKRHRVKIHKWKLVKLSNTLLILCLFLVALYYLPVVALEKLPWVALYVWSPFTLIPAVIAVAMLGVIYALYHILTQLYVLEKERRNISLIAFGLISGFGNAFIIFIINQSFGREDNLSNGLLFYFAFGILMYAYGQRYISTKLVASTNNMVYEKRIEIVGKILNMPYQKLENMEEGKVHTVLNNDTEEVSRSINVIISGAISLVTLICCFIYLGILNLYALVISIAVIVIVAGLFYLLGNTAEKLWEESRDIQNVFFRLIGDMLKGFKELKLNQRKKQDFENHMNSSSNLYRIKRTKADVRFANVNVAGELLFTFVIGVVAFLFPVLFPHLLSSTIQTYVFVFLYMTGPVNVILDAYPTLLRCRISWKRIKDLSDEIEELQVTEKLIEAPNIVESQFELSICDLRYNYGSNEDFTVGPFDISFRSGTISFITGGNGSGKTTLAKLLTGLYAPVSGEIYLNKKAISSEELSSLFSVIFSDYYLFQRLYGIDCTGKEDQIKLLLQRFQLDDKVTIQDGAFSTTMLSTGQKKRLALLVTYLENRPICLFDEWAADQDPEFRGYFYHDILPELKARGKCIIAITHDDRYFHMADSLIKLERGKMLLLQATE